MSALILNIRLLQFVTLICYYSHKMTTEQPTIERGLTPTEAWEAAGP